MNEGLVAAITLFVEEILEDDEALEKNVVEDADYPDDNYYLPPDIALAGYCNADPEMFDKAIHGPNAKEWQDTLDYKINQLKKHRTWAVEDLPPGQTAIPCSEVVRVK